MSKLALSNRVPRDYDTASLQEVVRQLETQANQHAEGKLKARHGAMTAAPTTGNWERGDVVDNSAPSVVSDAQADYVIVGWICTVSGTPGTWRERRVLVEDISLSVLGTEVAATSGTSIDFTGVPAWVKKIIIQFAGVSTNGTSDLIVQLGDSGGVETTGYLGGVTRTTGTQTANQNNTNGFGVVEAVDANSVLHGAMTLTLEDAANFTWVATMVGFLSDSAQGYVGAGSKPLSAALDRVRITTAGGTNTFDAGAINILMA